MIMSPHRGGRIFPTCSPCHGIRINYSPGRGCSYAMGAHSTSAPLGTTQRHQLGVMWSRSIEKFLSAYNKYGARAMARPDTEHLRGDNANGEKTSGTKEMHQRNRSESEVEEQALCPITVRIILCEEVIQPIGH